MPFTLPLTSEKRDFSTEKVANIKSQISSTNTVLTLPKSTVNHFHDFQDGILDVVSYMKLSLLAYLT